MKNIYKFILEGQSHYPFSVQTGYPEEVDFLWFSEFIKNPKWGGFAYECTDTELVEALHQNKQFTLQDNYQDIDISILHIDIIAKLITLIPTEFIYPIEFDTFSRAFSNFEGHHRLRALQYLFRNQKDFIFPTYLGGYVDFIQEFFHPIKVMSIELQLDLTSKLY